MRARKQIARALIALIEEGIVQPTARQVAEKAGVSLRLVFHHFQDMESLLKDAVAIQAERHWAELRDVPPDGPLLRRVTATIRQRGALYDAIAPVRRAASLAAGNSPTLAGQLATSRRLLRSLLGRTFAPELDASGPTQGASQRRMLLDALEVATSFETWDQLRRDSGRSPVGARKVIEMMVVHLLTSGPEVGDPAHT